ncbi:MAG: patatin-like phospholipase family protein [Candidatus Woesearchaeota archaeon]
MGSRPKIGLALGGGSARGLCHIGVLKVLHKNKIYPDYIAGTSMGSIIGALYAAGHTPEQIEELFKTTDWKNSIDFTIPGQGIIEGYFIESEIKKVIGNKKFSELQIPFRAVSVNLDTKKKVVFSKGNVARAVHASSAIPGIFAPVIIGKHRYVDGVLADPTPYDVVKEMGADIIIAVDLFQRYTTAKPPQVEERTLTDELKEKFIAEELLNVKSYLTFSRFPKFVDRLMQKLFDRVFNPKKIMDHMAKKEYLPLVGIIYESTNIMYNNFAKEKLKNAPIDILILPKFKHSTWTEFDQVDKLVKLGEEATKQKMPKLKKLMRTKRPS